MGSDAKRQAESEGLNWTCGYWCDVWPEPRWRAWVHTRDRNVEDGFGESTASEDEAVLAALEDFRRKRNVV